MFRIPAVLRRASLLALATVAATLLALLPTVLAPLPATAQTGREGAYWIEPVDAPIVDSFRRPVHRYGPGNRGLEYGTIGGEPVRAVAAGTVTFGRQIGSHRFVVIDHHDGLRSTYAYVEHILVIHGQRVTQGQRIATAARGFHLTARLGDAYIDPARLLAGARPTPRLVPLPGRSAPQVVPVPPSIRKLVPVMAPPWRLHT